MDLQHAKPIGWINPNAFKRAFDVSPQEARLLHQELTRQDVLTDARHGWELEGAARALAAVRGGL